MATLQDVARRANVSLQTAYDILNAPQTNHGFGLDTCQSVLAAAHALNYRLNITIRDVAAYADVSTATVSNVLNNIGAAASQRTREKVMHAIEALHYRPNVTARNLQSSRTGLIGYGWIDLPDSFSVHPVLNRFAFSMSKTAETHGYHILSFAERTENCVEVYRELYNTGRVDGFIIANTNRDDVRIRALLDLNIPFVAFGRANPHWDFPAVDVDGRAGMRAIMTHLHAQRRQRIALIGWPEGSLSGDERVAGYLDNLQVSEVQYPAYYMQRCENTIASGYQAMRALLDQARSTLDTLPDAVVCVSDTLAVGAIKAITEAGLSAGSDIAITGFDDDPLSALLTPPLTTLRQPLTRIGQMVVDMLVNALDGKPNQSVMLPPEIVIRESSTGVSKSLSGSLPDSTPHYYP